MPAPCTKPLRIAEVAAAAGCSVRTPEIVFRQFRGTTPLAALHMLRPEQARAALKRGAAGASTGIVTARYGFTNPSRFSAAFRRRFGETPSETARSAARS
ncbi:helix-turn-helix transcriptional regulator [Falsiroseomonas sp. E2-1-a20]|uniref:helix-turn-helix transcriptional regulator n=1 Tax=Falsiroseomonas sp. E2-1-a20 TaxID=3239300 RepID=UPI003F2DFC41